MKKDLKLDGIYVQIEDHELDEETPKEERFEIYIGDSDNSIIISKENMSDIVAMRDLFQSFIDLQNEIYFLELLKERNGDCMMIFNCTQCPLRKLCGFTNTIHSTRPDRKEILEMIERRIKLIKEESI